ncbi:MAG: 3-oxoacyl-[acyl-carrier-protein] reductase [Opitutaceae bacterium]|jgi:3-oxoacyl-[acyl-carrier protein] reductase|nr:3-oxoacyl-[acyl-carrier-protein] reductase [Opitutaceae bacterium]
MSTSSANENPSAQSTQSAPQRTALVTGAGRGIGKAIAEVLAAAGHTVICVSKSAETCGAVAAGINAAAAAGTGGGGGIGIGGKAVARAVDVADGAAVVAAAEAFLKEFGKIDILVNNAGITRDGLLARMSEDDWNAVLTTNLTSCFYWTKAIGWPMCRNRWGRIINISSVSGLMGNAGQANYAAAKAGMVGFTKSVAREFARRGVTANVVAPGFIKTDMTSALNEEVRKAAAALIPMQRFGETADIAHAVAFLASEQAGYITGQVFTVDGGMAM